MRRGLKLPRYAAIAADRSSACFKPIPDEEGTETRTACSASGRWIQSFKPIPDEEGTETRWSTQSGQRRYGELQTDPR